MSDRWALLDEVDALDAADVGADPAGTAASFASSAATALSNHEADTTSIHGIANTASLVLTGDSRLADARTPTAHATSHQDGGADELALDGSQITAGTVADARIASTIARDSEVTAAVAAEAVLARNADNLTSGTVADARIASTIARDSEVATALATAESYTDTSIANLIASAPAALDTLDELAAAFGDDANFATTMTNALALKAPLASPAFTGTPTGITKTHVGLGNVDNTSDANKPVSTAGQTALNLKANLASPTFTGTVTIPTGASITAPTGLVKGDVGLGSVDNTSDATKSAASVTLTNKTLTSPVLNTGVSGTAIDTDATMAANSDTILASQKATKTALALKAPIASPTFTGTTTDVNLIVTTTGLVAGTTRMVTNTAFESQGGIHSTGGVLGLDFIATEMSGGVASVDLRSTDATTFAGIGSGSSASPANRNLGSIHIGGDPGTGGTLVDVAEITCVATALFTGSSTPTKWEFRTNPVGSFHTRNLALTLGPDASAVFAGPLSGVTTLAMTGALSGATNMLDLANVPSNTVNIVTAAAGVVGIRGYGGLSIRLERVDGTAGAPSVIQSGDAIGSLILAGASAVSGTTATIYNGAQVRAVATETWTGTLGGSKIDIRTTPNGTHTIATAMTIDQDQSVEFFGNVGFYGVTPVAQASTAAAGTAAGAAYAQATAATWVTLMNAMRTCLRNNGLMA